MKKNIAVFVDYIKEGGGPMGYVYNLQQGLSLINVKEFNITIIGYDLRWLPKNNNKFYEAINKICRKSIYLYLFIKKIFVTVFYDVIVFQGYQSCFFEKIAFKINKKCVYMAHSPTIYADEVKMEFELKNKILSNSKYNGYYQHEENLFKYCSYIVFPTKNAANSYFKIWKDIILQKKVLYIKSGTIKRKNIKQNNNMLDLKNKTIIGFIGRYVTHKGYDLFCKCAENLNNEKDLCFISAGSGPLENCGDGVVRQLGYVKDIGSVIEQCNVIVIPNKVTYYDLLPIECASYGKPLIFSNVGGNIDQASDFVDSLMFESENESDLQEKILRSKEIVENKSDWGIKNQIKYEQDFTEKRLAERWIHAFKVILSDELQNGKDFVVS